MYEQEKYGINARILLLESMYLILFEDMKNSTKGVLLTEANNTGSYIICVDFLFYNTTLLFISHFELDKQRASKSFCVFWKCTTEANGIGL